MLGNDAVEEVKKTEPDFDISKIPLDDPGGICYAT